MKNNKNASIIDIDDIKSLSRIVSKNWYIFFISLVVFFIISYLYTYKLVNIYAAQTQISLESNDEVNQQSIISEDFGAYYDYWNQSNADKITEMRIIQSYDLIEKAIDRLEMDVSYFIVGKIKTTEVYDGIPFRVKVLAINPRFYEQEIDFKIIDNYKYQLTIEDNGEEIIKNGFFDKEFVDSDLKLFVENNSITKETASGTSLANYKIKFHEKSSLVYMFQSALTVENPEMTTIIQLRLEDVIPERAQTFLDTLTNVYIENSVKRKLEVNSNTLMFIEKQMAEVADVLTGIEDTMQNYKERSAILDLTKEQEDYFKKMSDYDTQKSAYKLQIETLYSLENYIIEGKDPQFLPPSVYVISDDAYLKQVVTELYNMQVQLNEKLNNATVENFAIKELEQRILRLKKNLLIYITNSLKAIKQKLEDIEEQIGVYVTNIKTIPKKQRDLLTIERNFEVNQKMYLFLLEKRSNTSIARASILPEAKVIESARNIGVVRPDKQKLRLFFIAIGFVIALVIVFIRTVFYSKIESIEELKSKTALPVLGEILFSANIKNWEIAVEMESKSPIAESFRTIRTNLQYMSPDETSKIIVITSNNPGEGKTFTSLNIAAIMAKAGKKVLVLELDLHKPKVQKALNMVADIGISTVVIGKTSIKDSIKSTVIENMDVLLSGPTPPNPSEMILSQQMKNILEYGKANYDYVIIDTPPVALISDALVLMKYADVTLFVLNTKFANKEAVQNAHDIVAMNQLKHFGFILNGVKRKRSKYYYNKYAYGYGYGYGYGDGYSRYGKQ